MARARQERDGSDYGFCERSGTCHAIDMTPTGGTQSSPSSCFCWLASSYVESLEQDVSIDLPSMAEQLRGWSTPARPITVNVVICPEAMPTTMWRTRR